MDEEDKQSDCDSDELGYGVVDTDEKNGRELIQLCSGIQQQEAIQGNWRQTQSHENSLKVQSLWTYP